MSNGAVASTENSVLVDNDLRATATLTVSVEEGARNRWGFPCNAYSVSIAEQRNEDNPEDVTHATALIDDNDARHITALFLKRARTVAGILQMAHREAERREMPSELCDALAVLIDRFAAAPEAARA